MANVLQNYFVYPLRVHIEDTDFGGHVYHSQYLNFMERARSEWVDELGMDMAWQQLAGILFVVHSANIQFLRPAKVHDRVEVISVIKALGRASIVFDQHLRSATAPDKILCKAEIKIACVDVNMRPRAIPEVATLAEIRRTIT